MAPLNALLSLLRGLRDADEDGRVIVEAESAKYCLLNPGKHFAKARLSVRGEWHCCAVCLAGASVSTLVVLLKSLF